MISTRLNPFARRHPASHPAHPAVLARFLLPFIAVSILINAASTHAEGPILTLAMARTDDAKAPIPSGRIVSAIPRRTVNAANTAAETVLIPKLSTSIATAEVRVQRAAGPGMANPLLVEHKNLANYGHSRIWATVDVGFGIVFRDKPLAIYGRNGTGWEEPSCGYLRVNLSF